MNMRKNELTVKQAISKEVIKMLVRIAIVGGSIWTYMSLSVLWKMVSIYFLATIGLPIVVFYGKAKLFQHAPKDQLVVDAKGNISKVRTNKKNFKGGQEKYRHQYVDTRKDIVIEKNVKFKKSQSPNLQLDIYKQVSEVFGNAMKSKLLKRGDIIQFKKEINRLLGKNIEHYKGFNFSNDAHEVYVKLKNQHLQQEDYEYLLAQLDIFMKSNLNNDLKTQIN